MEKLKEKTKFFTKTKICALMLLVAIITNMFSPYSVLLQESQAATPAAGEPYYELAIRPIDDKLMKIAGMMKHITIIMITIKEQLIQQTTILEQEWYS